VLHCRGSYRHEDLMGPVIGGGNAWYSYGVLQDPTAAAPTPRGVKVRSALSYRNRSRSPWGQAEDLSDVGFQCLLTLFSKSFSTFPHGTCLLSISRPVFSLRWNTPPDLRCTTKQHDSTYRPDVLGRPSATGLSPSVVPLSRGLHARYPSEGAGGFATLQDRG